MVLVFAGVAQAATVKFESKSGIDTQFLESNKSWIVEQYSKLESYFHAGTTNLLTVQVMPVSENPDFLSCARIYGTGRIYAHSPDSLKALKPKQREKYNSFCFERTYDDLKYTLVHEYVHVLTRYATKRDLPQWIWEGAAVALSGQLKHTQMGLLAKEQLKNQKSVDICEVHFSPSDAYLVGGALLNFYESKSPGFIFELIKFHGQSSTGVLRQFLELKKLTCTVPSSEILAII